jgi:hypothetical protein
MGKHKKGHNSGIHRIWRGGKTKRKQRKYTYNKTMGSVRKYDEWKRSQLNRQSKQQVLKNFRDSVDAVRKRKKAGLLIIELKNNKIPKGLPVGGKKDRSVRGKYTRKSRGGSLAGSASAPRPSPSVSAKKYKGRHRRGNDGNWWRSVPNKKGVHRWVRIRDVDAAAAAQPTSSEQKEKTRSKKKGPSQKRTCKRRRVRKEADGSLNQENMEHNRKCERKYMMVDNPWMKKVLSTKKPPHLFHIVQQRLADLKKKT